MAATASVTGAPLPVDNGNTATLYLKDKDPEVSVDDYKIGLAVALPSRAQGLPPNRVEDVPVRAKAFHLTEHRELGFRWSICVFIKPVQRRHGGQTSSFVRL
ncbi:hypothetical protein GCM10008101_27750 [Lysobacter xinjiangensis]|uniref:Uncharacterized protein n=1 Tax=Cognatilysobacter xinjiangensis TaxID=546892 RepID=A0ABQ3C7D3_9GAMM|nr:hypothetical protein GCM10008101_27750 [Lysobacter xinjiangensis]